MKRPKFMRKKRTWRAKFRDALRGLAQSFRLQSSYRVHFSFAFFALLAGFVARLAPLQWGLLLFAIGMVIIAEMFNTSLEVLAREVTDEKSNFVQLSLDISSGAVLVASIVAVAIGVILFGEATGNLILYIAECVS